MQSIDQDLSPLDRVGQVRLAQVHFHPLSIAGEHPPLWQKKLFEGPERLFFKNLRPEIIFFATSPFLARDG